MTWEGAVAWLAERGYTHDGRTMAPWGVLIPVVGFGSYLLVKLGPVPGKAGPDLPDLADGTLLYCPMSRDGAPDLDNLGEPDAICPHLAEAARRLFLTPFEPCLDVCDCEPAMQAKYTFPVSWTISWRDGPEVTLSGAWSTVDGLLAEAGHLEDDDIAEIRGLKPGGEPFCCGLGARKSVTVRDADLPGLRGGHTRGRALHARRVRRAERRGVRGRAPGEAR